jgi:hypothetical protein
MEGKRKKEEGDRRIMNYALIEDVFSFFIVHLSFG